MAVVRRTAPPAFFLRSLLPSLPPFSGTRRRSVLTVRVDRTGCRDGDSPGIFLGASDQPCSLWWLHAAVVGTIRIFLSRTLWRCISDLPFLLHGFFSPCAV